MTSEEAILKNTILFLKNANIFMEIKISEFCFTYPQGADKKRCIIGGHITLIKLLIKLIKLFDLSIVQL